MKAAVMVGSGKVEVQDVPEPKTKPEQIKVKIAYCGICGSELHAFQAEYQPASPLSVAQAQHPEGPRIMDMKPLGTIVEVGANHQSRL